MNDPVELLRPGDFARLLLASGELAPSLMAKIGSLPSVASNRARRLAGVTLQPSCALTVQFKLLP